MCIYKDMVIVMLHSCLNAAFWTFVGSVKKALRCSLSEIQRYITKFWSLKKVKINFKYVSGYEIMHICPYKHPLLMYGMILPMRGVKQGHGRRGNVHIMLLFFPMGAQLYIHKVGGCSISTWRQRLCNLGHFKEGHLYPTPSWDRGIVYKSAIY